MITLTNDFHGTSVNLRVGDDMRLSHSQVLRARRQLCGIDGCTCGQFRDHRYNVDDYQTSDGRWEAQITERYQD